MPTIIDLISKVDLLLETSLMWPYSQLALLFRVFIDKPTATQLMMELYKNK